MNNNSSDKITSIVQQNPFMLLLAQLHAGLTVTELLEAKDKVIEAVKKTGKKGSIKLTIVFTPEGKGEVQTVETEAKVATDVPTKAKRRTVFFVGENNELTRDDPNQKEIEFTRPAGVHAAAAAQ